MPVHETTYRRLEGARPAPSRFVFLPIAAYALEGHRRGWLYKAARYASYLPPIAVGFALYAMSQAPTASPVDAAGIAAARAQFALPCFEYFGVQLFFMTFFAALAGGPTVSEDLRRHALELYFSKPVTAFDYVLGKWWGLCRALAGSMLIPTLCAGAALVGFAPGGLEAHGEPVLRGLVAGAFCAAVCAFVAIGVSSVGRSARYAVVLWFVVTLFTHFASKLLVAQTRDDRFAAISFRDDLRIVCARIMGIEWTPSWAGSEPPSFALAAAALAFWVALAALALRSRLRAGARS